MRGSGGIEGVALLIILSSICLAPNNHALKIQSPNQRKQASGENNEHDTPLHKKASWTWEEKKSMLQEQTRSAEDDIGSSVLWTFLRPVSQAFTRLATDAVSIVEEVRPVRDAWDGLVEALPLFWKGYFTGFESLLDLTYKGFTESGAFGVVCGFAEGTIHLATMTATGVMAGMYQGVWGVERTLEAIRASRQGKTWDNRLREWFFYNLDQEAQYLASAQPAASPQQPRRHLRRRVKETTYYDILNVPVDANSTEIKRAYYQLALTIHPDKSDDLSAEEKFRQLNTIYKTLMKDDLRAIYDQHGSCYVAHMSTNSDSTSQVNPYIFFSTLLGSHVVELYIGDLAIASMVDNVLLLTERADPQVKLTSKFWHESKQQVRRQVQIASHLRDRIESYVNDGVTLDEFQASCRYEADALAASLRYPYQTAFLLQGVSSGLVSETIELLVAKWARPVLGSFVEVKNFASNARVDRRLERDVRNLKRVVRKAMILYSQQSAVDVDDSENDEEVGDAGSDCGVDEDGKDLMSLLKTLSEPSMWQVLVQFSVNDVTRTIREATRRVLDDCGGDHDLRVRKAQALNCLGREFHDAFLRVEQRGRIEERELKAATLYEAVKTALLASVAEDSLFK